MTANICVSENAISNHATDKKNPLARGTAGLKFVRFVNHPADGVVD